MITARAKVRWVDKKHIPPIMKEERRITKNAYRPTIEFDDHKRALNESSWSSAIFNEHISGCESIITVRYLFDNAPYELLRIGATFKLYDGPHIIADGVITDVFDTCKINERFDIDRNIEVELYRVMREKDFGNLLKYGMFKNLSKTMKYKWLFENYDNAEAWGNDNLIKGNFFIIGVRVPIISLKEMFYKKDLDGYGSAYAAQYKYVNDNMISFRRVL